MDYSIFQKSEDIAALVAALAEAQKEIEGATKDAANPHFRSKYATLASVWEAWQRVGPKNGLAVIQSVLDADRFAEIPYHAGYGDTVKSASVAAVERQGVCLGTLLAHKSGQYVHAVSFFPANKKDPQIYVAAVTYARRATLAAMVGICPEDDDGNQASGHSGPATKRSPVSAADATSFRKQIEEAITKWRDNSEKLTLLRPEAEKIGAADLVLAIDQRLKELRS